MDFHIDQRLSFEGQLCTVRYIGPVQDTSGTWLGVEWDDSTRGKHSGSHKGQTYFKCLSTLPNAASFVRPSRRADPPLTFLEAAKHKYVSDGGQGIYQVSGFQDDDSVIRISGKEVEEVGFEKVRRQMANLRQLPILLVDSLCIHRPEARSRVLETEKWPSEIVDACPKVRELDVGRNLFEDWAEVLDICRQLPRLTKLRVDGNRFSRITLLQSPSFGAITFLGLDDTLLAWPQISTVASLFRGLTTLSVCGNEYDFLTEETLPSSLKVLHLERNRFTSLEDVKPLASASSLEKLDLRGNQISMIQPQKPRRVSFPSSLREIDLAYNELNSWVSIDELGAAFPGMASLRISHNPLFQSLQDADGRALLPEDGYMLTIARLGTLSKLNFSQVDSKERRDAEVYYLSQINKLLSGSKSGDREALLTEHARYEDLCRIYGESALPSSDTKSSTSTVDPRSLEASLITITFKLDAKTAAGAKSQEHWIARLPRSFTIYTALSFVARHFGLPPMKLQLVWETGEDDVVQEELDIDSEEEDATAAEPRHATPKQREDTLVPQTRALGTWIETPEAVIRVEWSKRYARKGT